MHEGHLLARGEEADGLGLQVGPHEPPKHVKLLLRLDQHVVVLQPRRRGRLRGGVHRDVLRLREGEGGEVGDAPGLRCREEQGLPLARQLLEDGRHRLLEAEVEQPVGLVEDEHLDVREVEAGRLVDVVKQPAWRGDEDVHRRDPRRLLLLVLASDHEPSRQVVLLAERAQHVKDLESELAGRRDDEATQPVERTPPLAPQQLE
mmetsp:Transcript_7223/g.23938  ORF Transcript_7223/g.23938 Transcript_7223/m.23938 type:complete len:204 (-) Transcript_7223:405-1016(-)